MTQREIELLRRKAIIDLFLMGWATVTIQDVFGKSNGMTIYEVEAAIREVMRR